MSAAAPTQTFAAKPKVLSNSTRAGLLMQRKCACGSPTASLADECPQCKSKKGLQTKLAIGASNDPLESEADRVADQVLATNVDASIRSAPLRIQRYLCQAPGRAETVPASVERVLAGSGTPLEPVLKQDMEQRFGYDFSSVRVHSSAPAQESAREVSAEAYTVGHNIVFGAGRYAPASREGRRLIAHELTHVVQQSRSDGIRTSHSKSHVDHFAPSQGAQTTARDRQQATAGATTSPYLARAPLTTSTADSAAAAQARAQRIQRIFRPKLNLEEVMGIIESIRPSESASGMYVLVRDGEVLTLTQDEYDKIRASARKTLLDGIRKVRGKVEDARLQYEAQHKIDQDHWLASRAVRLFGGIKDPGDSIRQYIRFATANVNAAQTLLEHGQFVRPAEFFAESEKFAIAAKKASQAYVDNIISTGETTVTVLEVTAGVAAATVVVIGVVLAAPAIAAAAQAAPLAIALSTAAVPAAPVVAVETAAVVAPAAAAVAAPTAAVALPAAAAVAVPTTVAVAAPATAAVAVPAVAATSSLSTAALATTGIAVASTALSSDSPQPVDKEKKKEKKRDACLEMLNLRPGINDRWHRQRGPIAGHTTVFSAAFRLDGGIDPPAGQDTTPDSRNWVRTIGLPKDDAGHVIASRFGGRADFNSPSGNIFPQDLSFNRGTMRVYDAVTAGLHQRGCDVCAHIGLIYDSPTALRPSSASYTYLYRSVGASGFNPPISAQVPNP